MVESSHIVHIVGNAAYLALPVVFDSSNFFFDSSNFFFDSSNFFFDSSNFFPDHS